MHNHLIVTPNYFILGVEIRTKGFIISTEPLNISSDVFFELLDIGNFG